MVQYQWQHGFDIILRDFSSVIQGRMSNRGTQHCEIGAQGPHACIRDRFTNGMENSWVYCTAGSSARAFKIACRNRSCSSFQI